MVEGGDPFSDMGADSQMNVEIQLSDAMPERDTALTIGVFDGIHLGHRRLVQLLKEEADQRGLLATVMTFDRHPQQVLHPESTLPYLTSKEEKLSLLRQLGVDLIIVLPFTHETAQLTARQFVSLLRKQLRMRTLVVGPDFALGRGREGDATYLKTLSREMDFRLVAVPTVRKNGEIISSTAIRTALASGELNRVTKLLGRPFSISGQIGPGAERGRKLGFPTANLSIDPGKAVPPDGVYVTLAFVQGREYPSVTNIGMRPTFGDGQRNVEVFILDFKGDLYGQELRIDLIERLRGEKRFANVDDLKVQIARDVEQVRAILGVRK